MRRDGRKDGKTASRLTPHASLLTPQSWLITGGCGFIGVNVVDRLLRQAPGVRIRILDNLSVGTRDDLERVIAGIGPLPKSEDENAADGSWRMADGPAQTDTPSSAISPLLSDPRPLTSDLRPPTSPLSPLSSDVELVVGDILDQKVVGRLCKGADVVVHLAANTGVLPSIENPERDCQINVTGTLNCLEAARQAGVRRFVFASSGAPLGQQAPPIHENMAPRPLSPYGASKLAGEGYCSAYYGSFGVETVVLRFGNAYGPLSTHKGSVVAKFIRRLMQQQPLPIYGDGNQTRDFIFIDDLVQAVYLAATMEGIAGEVFQIATHQEHTVIDVAETLNDLARQYLGYSVPLLYESEKNGEIRRNYSDISRAKRMLGFEPRVRFKEGIERTFKWFLSHRP